MRRLLCILSAWLTVLPLLLSAQAAQQSEIIQYTRIEGTQLTVACANMESGGTYHVSLNGTELPVQAQALESTQAPVTIFCLVDTSGSMSYYKKKLLQETLLTLSQSLRQDDTMVIATIDNHLEVSDPLPASSDWESVIGRIQPGNLDTDLYTGIVSCLELLSSDQRYSQDRCLVVLSDGDDCQSNGMTDTEVLEAVKRSRIPVYTVALVQKSSEQEGGKILGSFSRASYGGIHQTTVAEGGGYMLRTDVSGADFAGGIWENMMATSILQIDLSQAAVSRQNPEVTLYLTYEVDARTYSDEIALKTEDFPPPPVQETTEAAIPETTVGTTVPIVRKESTSPLLPAAAGVAAVIVLAAVVVWCVVRRKKKAGTEAAPAPESPPDPLAPTSPGLTPPESATDAPASSEPDVPRGRQYLVTLVDIPHGRRTVQFTVPENVPATFGRTPRSACILNPEDSTLSGVHFSVIIRENGSLLQDEGSQNGTFLNGIPIPRKSWIALHSHDKIRAGGYEYRIIITPASMDGSGAAWNRGAEKERSE